MLALGQSVLLLVMGDGRVQEVDGLSDLHAVSFIEDKANDEHVSLGSCHNVDPVIRVPDVCDCRKNTYA